MAAYPHLYKSRSPGAVVFSMKFSAVGEGLEAAQQLDEWLRNGFNFVFSIFLPLHCPQQLMSVLTDIVCPRNQPSGAHLSTRDTTTLQQCNALIVTNPTPLSFRTSGINSAHNSPWNCKWEAKLSGKLSGKSDRMGREKKKNQQNNKKIILSLRNRKQAVPPEHSVCCKEQGAGMLTFANTAITVWLPYIFAFSLEISSTVCDFSPFFLQAFCSPAVLLTLFLRFSPSFPSNEDNRKAVCRGRVSDGSAAVQCSHTSGGTSWHWVHHPVLEPCLQQRAPQRRMTDALLWHRGE